MAQPLALSSQSGISPVQIVRSDPLPQWEELPPEQQRELVLLLATLLLKRLASHTQSGEVADDD